MGIQREQI